MILQLLIPLVSIGVALCGMHLGKPLATEPTTTVAPSTIAPPTPEQLARNHQCKLNCVVGLCYLEDPTDCTLYLTCQQTADGNYHGTTQVCAHGTYWSSNEMSYTCIDHAQAQCPINYCHGKPTGFKYAHPLHSCRTYWSCGPTGAPQAECCPEGNFFDGTACRLDTQGLCNEPCPLHQDECITGAASTPIVENCLSYWNCSASLPMCCPLQTAYDRASQQCVRGLSCAKSCPPQFEPDACQRATVHDYPDNSCRTYLKCVPEGMKKSCCPSQFTFTGTDCVKMQDNVNYDCTDVCPFADGFEDACPLEGVPENPEVYRQDTAIKFCAPGTTFNQAKCGCADFITNAPDNSCNKDIDMTFRFPDVIRSGSQNMTTLETIGSFSTVGGALYEGAPSFTFDGSTSMRISYMRQAVSRLYLKVVYKRNEAVPGRRILISNCVQNVENNQQTPGTIELSLGENMVTLRLVTENSTATVAVKHFHGQWNQVDAIYNGVNLYMMNTDGVSVSVNSAVLSGDIQVTQEALDIGGCHVMARDDAFQGDLAKVGIAKCLMQEWIDNFNTKAAKGTAS